MDSSAAHYGVGLFGRYQYDPLAYLVRDIEELLAGDRVVSIQKVQRCQNNISHFLANRGRTNFLSEFWPDGSCNLISQFVNEEALNE